MNKLLSAFILAAFLFINTASAATWVAIGTNTKDEVWYYDADSVIRDESGFYSLRLAYRKPGNKKWQESELSISPTRRLYCITQYEEHQEGKDKYKFWTYDYNLKGYSSTDLYETLGKMLLQN